MIKIWHRQKNATNVPIGQEIIMEFAISNVIQSKTGHKASRLQKYGDTAAGVMRMALFGCTWCRTIRSVLLFVKIE